MSLQPNEVNRIFGRMAATYGAAWTRQWADVPMDVVKGVWAHELRDFSDHHYAIDWALENLPARCPNAIEFRNLCMASPPPPLEKLPEPEPVADPERLKREFAKLGDLSESDRKPFDRREWARRILEKVKSGQKVSSATVRMAREALGLEKQHEE